MTDILLRADKFDAILIILLQNFAVDLWQLTQYRTEEGE